MPLGYDNSTSYARACMDFLKIEISKENQFIDWRTRPLSKDKIDYERTILKEMVDKIERNDKKVKEYAKNFSKSVRDASEVRLTLQTLFDMYVSQKKKLWVVKQDATRARDKYNKAMSQLEQSRTATDIQRTEFQQHLNKVTLEQDEAVARALLMDNDDIDFNNNDILKAKTTVYDNIKVAAPGSSEETIASLKTMQQMQKSHTAIAKKKIVEMEKEKKLIDERVKQLVRRLVEKDSKVKKLEEKQKSFLARNDAISLLQIIRRGLLRVIVDTYVHRLSRNGYARDVSHILCLCCGEEHALSLLG